MKRGVANFFILVYLVNQNINAGSSQSIPTQAGYASATSQTRASGQQPSSPSSLTQSSSSTATVSSSSQPQQVVLLNNEQANLNRLNIVPNVTPNLQYVYYVDQNGNTPVINNPGGNNRPQGQCNAVNDPFQINLKALAPVVVPNNIGPCPTKVSRVENSNVPSQIQELQSNRPNPQIQIYSADCTKNIQSQAPTQIVVKANEVRSQSQGSANVYQNVNCNNRQESDKVLYQNQAQTNIYQDLNNGNNIQRNVGNVIVSRTQNQAAANILQNPRTRNEADLFVIQNQGKPTPCPISGDTNQIQGNQGPCVVAQIQQTTKNNQNLNNNQVSKDAGVVLVRTNGQNNVNTIKRSEGIYEQSLATANMYQNSNNNPAYININQAPSSANEIGNCGNIILSQSQANANIQNINNINQASASANANIGNGGNTKVSQTQANADIQNFNNNQVPKNEANLFFVQNQAQSVNPINANVVLTQNQASANVLQTLNPNQIMGNQPNVVLTQNQAQTNVYHSSYDPKGIVTQNTVSNNNCQNQNINQMQVNQVLPSQVQNQDKTTTAQQFSTNIVPTSYGFPQGQCQQQLNQVILQNIGNSATYSVPTQSTNQFTMPSQGTLNSEISPSVPSSSPVTNLQLQSNNLVSNPKLPSNVPCANIVQFISVNNTQSFPQRPSSPPAGVSNSNIPSNNYQCPPTSANVPVCTVNGQQNFPISSISFNPTVSQNAPTSASSFNVVDRNNLILGNPISYVSLNSNAGCQATTSQIITQPTTFEKSLCQSTSVANIGSTNNGQQNIGIYQTGNPQNCQKSAINVNQLTNQNPSGQPNNCNQGNVKTVSPSQCGVSLSNSKQSQEQKSVLSKVGIDKSRVPHTVSIYNGGVPTPRTQPNSNLPSAAPPGVLNNVNRVNPNLCPNPASYLSVSNDATQVIPNVFSGCNQLPVVPVAPSIAQSDLLYSNVLPTQSTPYSPCLASPPTVISSAPIVPNLSPVNYISTTSASSPVFDSYSNFVSNLVGSILSVFDPETLLKAAADGYSPAVLTTSNSYDSSSSQDFLVQAPFEVYEQPQYIEVSPSYSLSGSNTPLSAVMPLSIRLDNSGACPSCSSSSSSGCQCYDSIYSAPVLPPVILDGDDDDDDESSSWRDVLKLAVFNKYLSCNGGCNGVNPIVALLLAYM